MRASGGTLVTFVVRLDHARARERARCGGKASALAEMIAAGFSVPAGVVVTIDAFDDAGALRAEARDELRGELAALHGPFAVRSSGIAEDLVGASFAGQYETVLDVEGFDAVVAAIATCVASVNAPRVAHYRRDHDIRETRMAVLVQELVRPRAAGVAFTAHPVTGERDVVVVSATAGLGEALVSGERDGEEWDVRRDVAPIRRRGRERVLREGDARNIAELARQVASASTGGDVPTDIEWALREDGSVALLQARPMTAVPEPVSWQSPAPGGYLRNFRLGEWLGAPMTPLCRTWIVDDLERQLHAYFYELSGARMAAEPHVVVNGWYFYGGLNFKMGFGALVRIIKTLLSKRRAQLLAAIPPVAHKGFDREVARWRDELLPALRKTVADAEARVERARPVELLAIVQSILDATAAQFQSVVGVAGYAAKAEGKLFALWRKHLREHDGAVLDVVVGAQTSPAAHDVEGLDPIFPTLGERGALPASISDETRARVLARRDEAEARALEKLKPRAKRIVAAAIAEARRAHAIRIEQTGLVTLGWPVLRRALLRLGEHAVEQGAIAQHDEIFFVERAELEAVAAGRATHIDVEARRALWERQRKLVPPLVVGELTGLAKKIFAEIDQLLHHAERDIPGAIVGMPGSPGRVTGPARIVRSVDELDRLQPGEVLIAPVTTPAWTLGFGRAIAIVTDTGSIASHASIVAREHGIPAVVGTGTATAQLVDGALVTVDGGRGVVLRA
ncbi:MAG TPA: PEP/pyruvate-binding domain-containing protein [Kofleriaceae bacterium]|nr:PEP/pyruvate-binding domain-containing protein [Kofleriaceae bacterium]